MSWTLVLFEAHPPVEELLTLVGDEIWSVRSDDPRAPPHGAAGRTELDSAADE